MKKNTVVELTIKERQDLVEGLVNFYPALPSIYRLNPDTNEMEYKDSATIGKVFNKVLRLVWANSGYHLREPVSDQDRLHLLWLISMRLYELVDFPLYSNKIYASRWSLEALDIVYVLFEAPLKRLSFEVYRSSHELAIGEVANACSLTYAQLGHRTDLSFGDAAPFTSRMWWKFIEDIFSGYLEIVVRAVRQGQRWDEIQPEVML